MPLPGKIDPHFSSADRGAKGWDTEKLLGLLEKGIHAIALSEVDDNKISQSGIGKLFDDAFKTRAKVYSPLTIPPLMSGSSANVLFEFLVCHLVIVLFFLGFLKHISFHSIKRDS